MHNLTMIMHIQYKFQEISPIDYLVMSEDGKIVEIYAIKGQ